MSAATLHTLSNAKKQDDAKAYWPVDGLTEVAGADNKPTVIPRRQRAGSLAALFGFLLLAATLLLGAPRLADAAGSSQSLLGMSIADAQDTDFFTFFHLNEIYRDTDLANRVVVNFKPENKAMSNEVTVRATVDSQERIVQMSLFLARRFVDAQVFARDIAKSFLLDSLPPPDRDRHSSGRRD
jgi:hypothetical protein